MYKNYNDNDTYKVVGIISLGIIAVFILPWISFWLSYFGGWIAKLVIGNRLTAALNLLFRTDYFKPDMLPMMSGALGWIASFFRTIKWNSKKNY